MKTIKKRGLMHYLDKRRLLYLKFMLQCGYNEWLPKANGYLHSFFTQVICH